MQLMDVISRFHQAREKRSKTQHLVITKLLATATLDQDDYIILANIIRHHQLTKHAQIEIKKLIETSNKYSHSELTWLAGLLFYYYGDKQQKKRGLHYIICASERRFPAAQFELGLLYSKCRGQQAAITKWTAAATSGYKSAIFSLGKIAVEQRDWKKANDWLNQCQMLNYPPALTLLGMLAAKRNQSDDAVILYYLGASAGESIALFKLAEHFICCPSNQGDLQMADMILREVLPALQGYWHVRAKNMLYQLGDQLNHKTRLHLKHNHINPLREEESSSNGFNDLSHWLQLATTEHPTDSIIPHSMVERAGKACLLSII